ncbi:MAG TPA: hypothetical protein VFH26_01240 [Gemmatimonadales bacterium]|nr:hypothetical protein [Gemmatimonadales bacterium]
MRTRFGLALALFAGVAACDRPEATAPQDRSDRESAVATGSLERAQRGAADRLARRIARALGEAEFRAFVREELSRSPYVENKLQLQRFLTHSGRRAMRDVARLSGEGESAVEADAKAATPLEIYFPVAAHRAAWSGGPDILVASAREDGDAPIAYDVKGARRVLSAETPPDTPVLAIVPVETDFGPERPAAFAVTPPPPPPPDPLPPPSPPLGMYMTYARFVQDFEGWFKGDPEYEIHILGQAGTSDSLTDYQCSGGAASGYYRFDQNNLEWAGQVLLFSQTQLNNYKIAHPNQNFRIIALEDDDGGCQIKFDGSRFKNLQAVLQAEYPNLTGSKDTTSSIGRIVKRANALQKILRAAYSFITTQDDLIGNAIEDVVVGQFISGANWIIRGEGNTTNGWIKLRMMDPL